MKFTGEDDPRAIEADMNEEGTDPRVVPSTKEMVKATMWVHGNVGLLEQARTTHIIPDKPEELDITEEEWIAQNVALDPFDDILKNITKDSQVTVSKNTKMAPWVIKVCGDPTEYLNEKKQTVCNGTIVVRSLQWPGAYNFYNNGKTSQIYVGNGHKYEEKSYFPVHPPTVNEDPAEYQLQPEPTPLEAPPVQEAEPENKEDPEASN